jgi:hypothetical protein
MQKMESRLVALSVLAVLVMSLQPAAFASTLAVNLDPNSKVAKLTSVSTTNLVLTYPANSTLSTYLKSYNSSLSLSGNFNSSDGGLRSFQAHLDEQANDSVSVQNMTVAYKYNAKANATAFVVALETDITAQVAGVFKILNGTVTADLGWKSFHIDGAMDLNLEGRNVDVNQVGSSLSQSIAGNELGAGALAGMFAGNGMWAKPTLNFSSLSTPLSDWTRSYDSITNTTTYSKTISGQATLSSKYSNGGETYSLTVTSDPSASISTHGYAVASGNSLVITKAPLAANPISWVAAVAATMVILGSAAYLVRRSRAKGRLDSSTLPGPLEGNEGLKAEYT